MFTTAILQTMFLHQYFQLCFTTGMKLRAALVTAIYKKTLLLSNASRQQSTVGEVIKPTELIHELSKQKQNDSCFKTRL